jgi:hypothetical protein
MKYLDIVKANPNNYSYQTFDEALKKHFSNYSEFPINIKLGDSKNISLTASSLKDLIELFNIYEDKIYDHNKSTFNFSNNPNILYTEKPINNLNTKECNLNKLLSTTILNILSSFIQNKNNKYLFYCNENNVDSPIADFILLDKLETDSNYKFIKPLNPDLSLEYNYFFLINNLLDKDILNPNYKYNWQNSNNIIENIPKEWKQFKSIRNNLTNKNNQKILNTDIKKYNTLDNTPKIIHKEKPNKKLIVNKLSKHNGII